MQEKQTWDYVAARATAGFCHTGTGLGAPSNESALCKMTMALKQEIPGLRHTKVFPKVTIRFLFFLNDVIIEWHIVHLQKEPFV